MHLPALNIPDLFFPLLRGKAECEEPPADNIKDWRWVCLKGRTWKHFGKEVADATPFIPGMFERPPRNPAKKISSGYKAWEFLLLFYGLGPCLLYQRLGYAYWRNYCKLVKATLILLQHNISQKDLKEAEDLIIAFSIEFEKLYVDGNPARIHLVRPSHSCTCPSVSGGFEAWTRLYACTVGNGKNHRKSWRGNKAALKLPWKPCTASTAKVQYQCALCSSPSFECRCSKEKEDRKVHGCWKWVTPLNLLAVQPNPCQRGRR